MIEPVLHVSEQTHEVYELHRPLPRLKLSAAALQACLSPRLFVHLVGAMSSIKAAEIHRAQSKCDIQMPDM